MKAQILLTFSVAFLSWTCQQNSEAREVLPADSKLDRTAIKQQFQSLEDSLALAYKTKDVDLFKRFYADDAISYGEGRDQLYGRKQMVNYFITNILEDTSEFNFTYHSIDVFTEGDLAVETGKWVEENSEGEEIDHGFYMVVYEKDGDRWVSVRDIWNSSSLKNSVPVAADE